MHAVAAAAASWLFFMHVANELPLPGLGGGVQCAVLMRGANSGSVADKGNSQRSTPSKAFYAMKPGVAQNLQLAEKLCRQQHRL
jgi:hypothetical protein